MHGTETPDPVLHLGMAEGQILFFGIDSCHCPTVWVCQCDVWCLYFL